MSTCNVRPAILAGIAILTFAFATGLIPARADDESAVAGDVSIEEVAASPARAGGMTRVTFTVENQGTERVTVTGLKLPSGEPSRVVGFLGTSHSTNIGGVTVGPGEMARLGAKTAWIEVGPLKSDLLAGTVVAGSLLLGRFETPISVHVVADPNLATGSVRSPR